jgi:hypothetical protein
MSWKHQSLRSLEAVALALYQDTLQVLRMAYNLKTFVGSRKIIQRTFKLKVWRATVQVNAKPFLLSKIQSALHLNAKKQQTPTKQRLGAKPLKNRAKCPTSDSPTKSKSISEQPKHQSFKVNFLVTFAQLLHNFLATFWLLSGYFPNSFVAVFQRTFTELSKAEKLISPN